MSDHLPAPPFVSSPIRAIGRTPLVRLGKIVPPGCADVFVKLEALSPTGSYKDRMALAMIEEDEKRGDLTGAGLGAWTSSPSAIAVHDHEKTKRRWSRTPAFDRSIRTGRGDEGGCRKEEEDRVKNFLFFHSLGVI
jgi:hypothetical protein